MWVDRSRTCFLALLLAAGASLHAQTPQPEGKAPAPGAKAPTTLPPTPQTTKAKKPKAAAPAKAEVKPEVAAMAKARSKSLKAAKAKGAPKGPVVDINHASKEELKKLPGITEAYASKIIAGRPYKTKAHLVTKDVLPYALFTTLKDRLAAAQ